MATIHRHRAFDVLVAMNWDLKISNSFFFFSSRRRHTRSTRDWSSDVWSSDLFRGILRAALTDIQKGTFAQGGSTITQQLVRNLYIGNDQRTLERKLREACLALRLSASWSKNRILAAYLNQVYYGNHAYGIEAAAQTYFSRTARRLSLAQSALLAGLPQAPSVYDPLHRPNMALKRRNEVLRAMAASRYITPGQLRYAVRQPLG